MAYVLGEVIPLAFSVADADGLAVDPGAADLTIVKPDGTTASATLAHPAVGSFTCDYVPVATGRHVAQFETTGAYAGLIETVFDVVSAALALVSLADVKAYLGDVTATDAQIADALAVEQDAQAARCRIDPYTHKLRGALMRRVARNLAARSVPIAEVSSFDGVVAGRRVTNSDPEIDRLEADARKWMVR